MARQANEVLAADLRLRSQEPVPQEWRDLALKYDLETAETMSFPSVVFNGDESALATIKVVSDSVSSTRAEYEFPINCLLSNELQDGIPLPGEVWADGALLARVGADVGDTLAIGELTARVSAVLTYRPDQSIGFASFAPSLMMNIDDVSRSALIGEGSRVRYALLIAGNDEDVADFNDAVQDKLPGVDPCAKSGGEQRACLQCGRQSAALPVT